MPLKRQLVAVSKRVKFRILSFHVSTDVCFVFVFCFFGLVVCLFLCFCNFASSAFLEVWLVGWLFGRSVGWLIGWLVGSFVY